MYMTNHNITATNISVSKSYTNYWQFSHPIPAGSDPNNIDEVWTLP